MSRKQTQKRVEWLPGPAAADALQVLRALHPGRSQQDLIDLALIRMAWAERFPEPQMPGRDRTRWTLPAELQLPRARAVPELRAHPSRGSAVESSGTPCSGGGARHRIRAIDKD